MIQSKLISISLLAILDIEPARIENINMEEIAAHILLHIFKSRELTLEILDNKVNGHSVVIISWNDNIGIFDIRLDKSIKSRLNEFVVLIKNTRNISSSFFNISKN